MMCVCLFIYEKFLNEINVSKYLQVLTKVIYEVQFLKPNLHLFGREMTIKNVLEKQIVYYKL